MAIVQLVGNNKDYIFKTAKIKDGDATIGSAIRLDYLAGDGGNTVVDIDVYDGVVGTVNTISEAEYIVVKEFINYNGNEKIDDMDAKQNELVRVVRVKVGKEIVLSNDSISGVIAVGSYVTPLAENFKMGIVAVKPATGVIYEIIKINEGIRVGQRSETGIRVLRIA